MADTVYSDWRQDWIEASESKIMELDYENARLRKALEEIRQTVIAGQNSVYPFVFYLDSKEGAFILETVNNALKEKTND